MKKLLALFFLNGFLFVATLRGQEGLFVNGPAAALMVPATNTLYCNGDFRVVSCDPVLQVRFAGSLYLTSNLEANGKLRFNPTLASQSKLCRLVFLPGNQSFIIGTVAPVFWELEIDKGGGNSIVLNQSIICRDTLNFKSGFLYINGNHCTLQDPVGATDVISHPWIKSERNGSQFLASNALDSGKVIYNSIYTHSVNFNSANIGLRILGLVNTGSPVTIIRGFKNQINAAKGSIGKYFDVYSPGHKLVNNQLDLNFYLNDAATSPFNFINTSALQPYFAPLSDSNWTPFSSTLTTLPVTPSSINGNMQVALSQLRHPFNYADSNAFRITLADPNCLNPPQSQLGLDTVHICAGDSLILNAGNSSTIPNTALRYSWNTLPVKFTGTVQVKPTQQYQKFKVLLMDVKGCVSRDSVIVAPTAPFPLIRYFNFLNSCLGDSVSFKDTVEISSGTFSTTYLFSDQTTLQTNKLFFRKRFTLSGTHSVTLSTVSSHGCNVTTIRNNIQVYPLPTAAFSSSLNCVSRQTDFINLSASNTSVFPVTIHRWKFGDLASGNSSLTAPSYSYTSAGNYTVSLLCQTPFGCRDSISQAVQIYPQNTASFVSSNNCFGDTTYLQNLSACATGSCQSIWSYGDQSSSVTYDGKKYYSGAGLFQVKLKLAAFVGCSDSLTLPVVVNPRPIAMFLNPGADFCPNEFIYCTNTSSLLSGQISSVTWQFDNQPAGNTWNLSTSSPVTGPHTIKLLLTSDSGCVASSERSLTVHPSPQSQLFASPVCLNDSSKYVSLFQSTQYSYVLNPGLGTGSSTYSQALMAFRYNQPGTYTANLIIFSTYGCSDTSQFIHEVRPIPQSPFQGSISTCGESYVLDALNSGSSYNWLPGNQVTGTVNCLESRTYQVLITNTLGCATSASVVLKLNAAVKPQLGKDTTHCGPLILDAGYSGASFSWNNGVSSQKIEASNSGTYAVSVTDQNGCSGADTISVLIKNLPQVSVGPDTTLCRPAQALTLTVSGNASAYNWNSLQNGPAIVAQNSGLYWVEGLALNGCRKRDSIILTILKTPTINLGGSRSGCQKIILDAKNNGNSILWENGSTAASRSITNSTRIWVKITDAQTGCPTSDTANIIIHAIPYFNLGKDTAICSNVPYILTVGNTPGFVTWMNGTSSRTMSAASAGLYGATVIGEGACQHSDYVSIIKLKSPNADLGAPLRYLCGDKAITLTSNETSSLTWFHNTLSIGTSSMILAGSEGVYKLRADNGSCFDQDSVRVSKTTQTVQAQFLASTIDTVNRSVQFVNLSKPKITDSFWDFGDMTTSELENPLHTWVLPDNFMVRLKVSNGFCEDEWSSSLRVIFKQFFENKNLHQGAKYQITFYPNPAANDLTIHAEFPMPVLFEFSIRTIRGQKILEKSYPRSDFFSDGVFLGELSQGIYFITFTADSPIGLLKETKKLLLLK